MTATTADLRSTIDRFASQVRDWIRAHGIVDRAELTRGATLCRTVADQLGSADARELAAVLADVVDGLAAGRVDRAALPYLASTADALTAAAIDPAAAAGAVRAATFELATVLPGPADTSGPGGAVPDVDASRLRRGKSGR